MKSHVWRSRCSGVQPCRAGCSVDFGWMEVFRNSLRFTVWCRAVLQSRCFLPEPEHWDVCRFSLLLVCTVIALCLRAWISNWCSSGDTDSMGVSQPDLISLALRSCKTRQACSNSSVSQSPSDRLSWPASTHEKGTARSLQDTHWFRRFSRNIAHFRANSWVRVSYGRGWRIWTRTNETCSALTAKSAHARLPHKISGFSSQELGLRRRWLDFKSPHHCWHFAAFPSHDAEATRCDCCQTRNQSLCPLCTGCWGGCGSVVC